MANADRLLDIQIKKMIPVIKRGCNDILANEIKDKLIEKIFDNFYDRYDVGDTGWLIDSITVKVSPISLLDGFEIFVYWKNTPLRHTTWWGSDKYNIAQGSKVYTVDWINKGYTFLPDGSGEKMLDREGVQFIEDAIKELQLDGNWLNKYYNYLRKNGINIE